MVVSEDEAYKELANAIIIQALIDYRIGREQKEIERFFRSEWFMGLSRNCTSADEVIKHLREEDAKRISKRGSTGPRT